MEKEKIFILENVLIENYKDEICDFIGSCIQTLSREKLIILKDHVNDRNYIERYLSLISRMNAINGDFYQLLKEIEKERKK